MFKKPTAPKAPLQPGETVVKVKLARREHKFLKPIGGWLFLTNRRMLFEPAILQYSKTSTELPLDQIRQVERCWVRAFQWLPYVPWSLSIMTAGGEDLRFSIGSAGTRDEWIQALRAAGSVTPSGLSAPSAPAGPAQLNSVSGTKFCSGCGAVRDGAGKFCQGCGAAFA